DDMPVLHDDERRARTNAAARLRAKARERVGRVLLPVAVRLEDDRRAGSLPREVRREVLDEPCAEATRDRAIVVRAHAGLGRVTTEQQRDAQLDPTIGRAAARPRAKTGLRTDDDARGEVLDLPLAIDRRI